MEQLIFEGKTEIDAIEKAVKSLQISEDSFDVEIIEEKTGLFGKKVIIAVYLHSDDDTQNNDSVLATSKTRDFQYQRLTDEQQKKILQFIDELCEKLQFPVYSYIIDYNNDNILNVGLKTDYVNILIGKKGKNLESLQLIVNSYIAQAFTPLAHVFLDIEGYRMRREESLIKLAYTIADKVKRNKNSYLLDPMNAFERKIIHTTLYQIQGLETISEGSGMYKQVRIRYTGV